MTGQPLLRLLAAQICMIWAVMALCFVAAPAAHADEIKFPELTGRVVDDANMLSPEQKADLTTRLKALQDKNGRQLVVVTLPSLQGQDIQDFGYQLGRKWGIGQKGQNNGVLFIIAPSERKVRIEVGYGLEPILTDALARTGRRRRLVLAADVADVAGTRRARRRRLGRRWRRLWRRRRQFRRRRRIFWRRRIVGQLVRTT